MRISLCRWIAVAACLGLSMGLSQAAPVTITFNGNIVGNEVPSLNASLPVGTPVSWSLSYFDTLADGHFPTFADFTLTDVSGWLKIGGLDYVLDEGWLDSAGYSGTVTTALTLRFFGNGPQIGSGDLYGITVVLSPQFDVLMAPWITVGFTNGNSTAYFRSELEGELTVRAEAVDVPEPASAALLVAALLGLGASRRGARPGRDVPQPSASGTA